MFLSTVHHFMKSKGTGINEQFPTRLTYIGFLPCVDPFMCQKGTKTSKGFSTMLTCTFMPLEGTRRNETLPTVLTFLWFLSSESQVMLPMVLGRMESVPIFLMIK
jgi:hypothetical protein